MVTSPLVQCPSNCHSSFWEEFQTTATCEFMDAVMQFQWLNTEEESVWVLYREIMLQNFTGIALIPGTNKQGKGDLVGTV